MALAAPARDATARAQTTLTRLPLRFEANLGQWNPAVRYAARGDRYSVLLTAAGPSLAFGGARRVDLSLDGSNPAPEIDAAGRSPVRTDYFIGSKDRWRTNVPLFSRVVYRGVYPGIDVAYYGNASRLEYDFRLEPGADPSAIRLRIDGADGVTVGKEGDLVIETASGQLLQKLLSIYQADPRTGVRRPVRGRYALLAPHLVGFRVDRYDRSRPLVIDPYLVYSSYWGGQAADQINAVKVDARGLLYLVGSTLSVDLPVTGSAYAPTLNEVNEVSAYDVFIAVLDTTAAGDYSLQYLSYLGGSGDDFATGMDLDASGNLYIVGTTASPDFPMTGASVQAIEVSPTHNAFVAEFNPSAFGKDALLYSTYLGGSTDNYGQGIAVGPNGMIYVIGSTTSSDFPVTASAYAAVLYGPRDAFLCEIDPYNSALVYSTYLGGEDVDDGRAIAVGANGLVYFAITTDAQLFPLGWQPGGGPYRTTLQGVEDAIVGVMDMTQFGNPSLVYDTYFGGSDLDEVQKIAVDASGKLLVTGYTFSQDFPVTPDAVQPMPAGNGDAFVALVDPLNLDRLAFLTYSTYLGGSDGDVTYDVASDTDGNIYVAGYTLSPDFPVTSDAIQAAYGGGIDLFVTKLKPGVGGVKGVLFSTFIGGLGNHVPTGLAIGADGTVYVVGYTTVGLPAAGDNSRLYAGGATDGFVLAISQLAGQSAQPLRGSAPRAPRLDPPNQRRAPPGRSAGTRYEIP